MLAHFDEGGNIASPNNWADVIYKGRFVNHETAFVCRFRTLLTSYHSILTLSQP